MIVQMVEEWLRDELNVGRGINDIDIIVKERGIIVEIDDDEPIMCKKS